MNGVFSPAQKANAHMRIGLLETAHVLAKGGFLDSAQEAIRVADLYKITTEKEESAYRTVAGLDRTWAEIMAQLSHKKT